MKNWIDIIKNDIQLYNCIKYKFWDNVKLELLKDKNWYYYKSIDLKTWKTIFISDLYPDNTLYSLFYDIEILIQNSLYYLNVITEKHISDYENM